MLYLAEYASDDSQVFLPDFDTRHSGKKNVEWFKPLKRGDLDPLPLDCMYIRISK